VRHDLVTLPFDLGITGAGLIDLYGLAVVKGQTGMKIASG
jgi:hypothetical protein